MIIKHKRNQLEMVVDKSGIECARCYFVRWGGKKGKSRRCYKPDNFPPCKAHEREDGCNYIYTTISTRVCPLCNSDIECLERDTRIIFCPSCKKEFGLVTMTKEVENEKE